MTTKTIVRPLAFATILAAVSLPASAQWGPEEEKNCFLRGHKGTVTLSGQINDAQGDSSKLEQYEEMFRELPPSDVWPTLDAAGRFGDRDAALIGELGDCDSAIEEL